jgi:hypothetical protein
MRTPVNVAALLLLVGDSELLKDDGKLAKPFDDFFSGHITQIYIPYHLFFLKNDSASRITTF